MPPKKPARSVRHLTTLYHRAEHTTGIVFGELLRTAEVRLRLLREPPRHLPENVETYEVKLSQSEDYPRVTLLAGCRLSEQLRSASGHRGDLHLHRLVVFLRGDHIPPEHEVHHININTGDNRGKNLILAEKNLHNIFHRDENFGRKNRPSTAPEHGPIGWLVVTWVKRTPNADRIRTWKDLSRFDLGTRPTQVNGAKILAVLASQPDHCCRLRELSSLLPGRQKGKKMTPRNVRVLLDKLVRAEMVAKVNHGVYQLTRRAFSES